MLADNIPLPSLTDEILDMYTYNLGKNKVIAYDQLKPTHSCSNEETLNNKDFPNELYLASKLKPCETYGKLNNEQAYLDTFNLFLQSTKETRHRKLFFKTYIDSKPMADHFVDIGIGNGEITKIIAKGFRNATLIDNNKTILNQPILNNLGSINICKINHSICDIQLTDHSFDTIVLSHTIYYFNKSELETIFSKLFSALKNNGELIIVVSGGLDKHKIIKAFNGQLLELSNLTDKLYKLFQKNISILDIKESCHAYTEHAILNIAGFYLHDGNTSTTKNKLSQYIKQFKQSNGLYKIDFIQRFITIKK